jgi:hypothetical protein
MRNFIYGMVTIGLLVASAPARAEVFKCTAEDGGITYQQTPCPEQKVEPVETQSRVQTEQGLDCSFSNRFAGSTARLMRAGVTSNEVFNRYGGLDSLSRPSIGVINYVYSFRTSDDVTVERIEELADAKCQFGSFGEARCEALPLSFTDSLGGCDGEGESQEMLAKQSGDPRRRASTPTRSSVSGRSDEEIQTCKKHYRDSIDEIDAQMRKGYGSEQGEVFRQRLRQLTEKLRAC